MTNLCLNMKYMGSASTFPHMQGMFRQFIAVSASQCIPVPDSLDFAQASMAEPLAVALHALRQVGSLVGARVLMVGCGPIGCILLASARRAGAHHLTAVDLAQKALDMAVQLGADEAVLADNQNVIDQWSHSRGTFDVVIEASGALQGSTPLCERSLPVAGYCRLAILMRANLSLRRTSSWQKNCGIRDRSVSTMMSTPLLQKKSLRRRSICGY